MLIYYLLTVGLMLFVTSWSEVGWNKQ